MHIGIGRTLGTPHDRTYRQKPANFEHHHKMCVYDIKSMHEKLFFLCVNLMTFLWKLGSHRWGPGEHVDQGLGKVHHGPKLFCFIMFF